MTRRTFWLCMIGAVILPFIMVYLSDRLADAYWSQLRPVTSSLSH